MRIFLRQRICSKQGGSEPECGGRIAVAKKRCSLNLNYNNQLPTIARLIFLSCIVLFLTSLPSFAQSQKFITNLYGSYLRGLFYGEQKDYRAAAQELERAKKLDPHSVHLRLKLATFFLSLGELDRAEKELKEAKKIDPQGIDAPLALLFLYSFAQKDKELEAEYEDFLKRAQKIRPDDIRYSERLAQYYFYKKRFQEAVKIYEAIVENNPSYVEGIFWLGYLYEEVGKRHEAIEMWKRALKIDPDNAPTLNSLGYVYTEEGVYLNEAEVMIRKAVQQDPENGAYLDSLGWVYFKKGDYTKAEEYLIKAISYVKDPVIYEHLGDLYVKLGNMEKATRYYSEGLNYFPDSEDLQGKINKYEKREDIVPQE
ncbi:MAG: tetratricopeptide repeat protein [Candidatus Omnitrophota bacterium]|nr:MAG: tetratricopeptide repeat protein [Candidatus Omnitrophota bacterium]